MSKVIICIHGRANKPRKNILQDWWKTSIEEGLIESTNSSLDFVKLEMVYYADIHYGDNSLHENFNGGYQKAAKGSIRSYQEGLIDFFREEIGDWIDAPIDWLEEYSHFFSAIGRAVSQVVLEDLGNYYSNQSIRLKINNRLKDKLIKYKDDEIILVSHSMGTIIAYDVLRDIGKSIDHPNFTLSHFITMGSPLGLNAVKGSIFNDHKKIRTPSCIRGSWVNFSDPNDYVCLDSHLKDDYEANSHKVRVEDMMVHNDFPGNDHASFGYLRTPEFSKHLASLL